MQDVQKHPNADTLSIAFVHGGYPVIFQTGQFQEGDLAVYIPVDSIVPEAPEWTFLKKNRHIRARRIRGIFSMGLLHPAPAWVNLGDDLKKYLQIDKFDPWKDLGIEEEPAPKGWRFGSYTDIEGLRRWHDVLQYDEPVVITEKLHGENARYCWDGSRLWAGSRVSVKKPDPSNLWWRVAKEMNLEEKLKSIPGIIVYGEIHGHVKDFDYGSRGVTFRVFDMADSTSGMYINHLSMIEMAEKSGLQMVPELYRGPWRLDLLSMAEGSSTLANHVREGFVVKPLCERYEPKLNRVILKYIGEGYLLK